MRAIKLSFVTLYGRNGRIVEIGDASFVRWYGIGFMRRMRPNSGALRRRYQLLGVSSGRLFCRLRRAGARSGDGARKAAAPWRNRGWPECLRTPLGTPRRCPRVPPEPVGRGHARRVREFLKSPCRLLSDCTSSSSHTLSRSSSHVHMGVSDCEQCSDDPFRAASPFCTADSRTEAQSSAQEPTHDTQVSSLLQKAGFP